MTEGSQEAPASPGTLSSPPVPVRMLNEFAYCPRLGYLELVQGEGADGADTFWSWGFRGGERMPMTYRNLAGMRAGVEQRGRNILL
jgi:hypothetical protein